MKAIYRYLFMALLVLALVSTPFSNMVAPVQAASTCVDNTNSAIPYTFSLCIDAPADGTPLSGDVAVTASVTPVSGTVPLAAKMIFSLNGNYVITDFHDPFTFTLPTTQWIDGPYTLSVQVIMKDGFTGPNLSTISVTFNNGILTAPTPSRTFSPTSGTMPGAGQPFIIAAAGDGAGGEPNEADVATLIASWNPNLFLYIGDVYEKGTYTEFLNWYNPVQFFGQFKSITDPTPGNHDYIVNLQNLGYQFYWGTPPNYYSFDAGGWHIISLNSYSNPSIIDVTPAGEEYQWLQNDLNNNTNPCTLVFYHHPYLSIGQEGGRPALVDIWQLMAQHQVTIVLNGHDHEYQRWQPLDGNGDVTPLGMTEFVIGTGGHSLQTLTTTDNRVAFASADNPLAYGALKLALSSSGANFSYISKSGQILDTGLITCKGNATIQSTIYLPIIFR